MSFDDKNCITLPDGTCIGALGCMHDRPPLEKGEVDIQWATENRLRILYANGINQYISAAAIGPLRDFLGTHPLPNEPKP